MKPNFQLFPLVPLFIAVAALPACSAGDEAPDAAATAGAGSSAGGSSGGGQATAGASASGGSSTSGGGGNGPTGGATSAGGSDTNGGTGDGGATPFTPPTCAEGTSFDLPADAPTLTEGEWVHINPEGVSFGPGEAPFTQGMTIDPCNPGTLYFSVVAGDKSLPVGLYRTTNAGSNWQKIGPFQSVIRVRVDPADPLHLYVVDGVNGDTNGFWVSTDGGESWYRPQSFQDLGNTTLNWDTYHVEPDPADFNHVLVTYHNAWKSPYVSSGVIESSDGGDSWTVHDPEDTWYTGHDVYFLYRPDLGIGDAQTWLLGTQGDGHWRTTNAGESWTKVTDVNMDHGGGSIYYTSSGVLYASGSPQVIRSTDNGETWTSIGPSNNYYLSVVGDGDFLYTHAHHDGGVFKRAPENDDTNWTDLGMSLNSGTFELGFDPYHRILYSSNLAEGMIAMKLPQ